MIGAIFSYFAYSVYMSKNSGQTSHIIRAHLANSYNVYNSRKCISLGLAQSLKSSKFLTPLQLQLHRDFNSTTTHLALHFVENKCSFSKLHDNEVEISETNTYTLVNTEFGLYRIFSDIDD
jgi:hypothetical protein